MGNDTIRKRVSGWRRVDKVGDVVEAAAMEACARLDAKLEGKPSKYMRNKYRYKRVTFTLEARIEDER